MVALTAIPTASTGVPTVRATTTGLITTAVLALAAASTRTVEVCQRVFLASVL